MNHAKGKFVILLVGILTYFVLSDSVKSKEQLNICVAIVICLGLLLTTFLKNHSIRIFVGNAGTKLTELGFGLDLDGDGKITPGKWVDVNQDGQKQWFEVEDQFEDGKKWDQQPAAYNHKNRMIFISARVLKDPKFEKILKHEINHVLDLTYQDNPQLKVKWKAYISKLYNAARRQGKIAFDELDPHEYFAISEPF